jgi:general secretion pathway protein E
MITSPQQRFIARIAEVCSVSEEQLWEHWETARTKRIGYREHLVKVGLVKEDCFQQVVGDIVSLTFVDSPPPLAIEYQDRFAQSIPIRFAKKHLFYPLTFKEDRVVFQVVDPWPDSAFREAARVLGYTTFETVLSTEDVILGAINQGYDRSAGSAEEAAEVLEDDAGLDYFGQVSADETEDLLDVQDEEPIKKLMNSILVQSVRDNSSDIHIDPGPNETIVRNRIDGVLHRMTTVPRSGHIPLVNRVKVMAGLDISTKTKPQDGRTMILHAGRKIDIRVSIIPTVHGEQAVLRLLNQSQGIIPLHDLGMTDEIAQQVEKLVQQPHGIILVTGPTGSGKTTTLYSALHRVNASQKNIVTIEDPVEYRISAYGQMQVNEKVGVTFAKGLRAMLRQDPDVIMIGEMRDTETAQIAIQASLTGHLVLSTLHTNEAASTIVRLIDMGIEPYLVSSTVTAVLAQRLVRKICPHCRESYPVTWADLKAMGFNGLEPPTFNGVLWRGKGCVRCLQTGYQGRIGIFELLPMDDTVRRIISRTIDATRLKQVAVKAGMKGLNFDCAAKVLKGDTTVDEMLRVVFMDAE